MRLPQPVAQLGAVFDQLWSSRYSERERVVQALQGARAA